MFLRFFRGPNFILENISMIDTLGILWCAEETKGVDTAKQQDTDVALLEVHAELFLSLSLSLSFYASWTPER